MQAFWKFILWPALSISVGYSVINNPDAAVDFVTGIILFSASQPALTSILILFVFGLVITPYVLPVAVSAFTLLLLLQPSAIKSMLPAPPPIPKWLLPSPVRQVQSPSTAVIGMSLKCFDLDVEKLIQQFRICPSVSHAVAITAPQTRLGVFRRRI